MAWNEPGGGRDRDPWGGGGDQGPPDLDEALKKLQQRLGGLFGGRGGGQRGGGGSGASLSGPLLALVLASVVVVWALFGFYQVDRPSALSCCASGSITARSIPAWTGTRR